LREASFDRSHWWKEPPNEEPEAALYELARRHPLAETPRARLAPPGSEPPFPVPLLVELQPSLYWTRCLALKSWPKLSDLERTKWKSSVRKLKGLDVRPTESLCLNVTSLAFCTLPKRRVAAGTATDNLPSELRGSISFLSMLGLLNADHLSPELKGMIAANSTADEREAAIADAAVEAYRKGYVVLAVAPDLAPSKLASVVSEKLHEPLPFHPSPKAAIGPKQRARWENWLPLISEFEDDELQPSGAKSQVFARYRRAMEEIHFMYGRGPV
jgi:hypothetical protein